MYQRCSQPALLPSLLALALARTPQCHGGLPQSIGARACAEMCMWSRSCVVLVCTSVHVWTPRIHAELCLLMPACVHSCLWIHALLRTQACAQSHSIARTDAPALAAHTSASGSTAALWRSASLLKSLGKVRRAIDAYHAMLRHQPTDVRIGKELALLYAPPRHTSSLRTAWSSVRSKFL